MKNITKLKLALIEDDRHAYEIAREIGISETRLSRIANGRVSPTIGESECIAAALGADVRDLFERDA